MRIHMSIPKRLLALCLVFATGIGLGYLSDHFISENSRFQAFTDELFLSEVRCELWRRLQTQLSTPVLLWLWCRLAAAALI